ncbi:hypothetical protein IAD21_04458 [Abditibacteriota bacterium]|nr:hypothetical protein IAD21_04458 [Abditibacteriota bacterium]
MNHVPKLLFVCLPLLALSSPMKAAPNFVNSITRPLHFHPENGAFVVSNGTEFFNRPLYGANRAFRVDAGDRPEFSLWGPGRGGNLRLGVRSQRGQVWLQQAHQITARYVPGSMEYEISDPIIGGGTLRLNVQALRETQGLVVRVQSPKSAFPLELVWAYGGANGARAARNGDIGTEKVPMSQYFQLQPEACQGSEFSLSSAGFSLRTARADVAGFASDETTLALGDAHQWGNLGALLGSSQTATTGETPVVVGRAPLTERPFFIALEWLGAGREAKETAKTPSLTARHLARAWEQSEAARRKIATQIEVETPDPFINAAAPALCVAADGVWDERERVWMHGAVAWRVKLLGWRGPFAGDDLGWNERTRDHLMNWFARQNTQEVVQNEEPMAVAPSDAEKLARNEPALHSNGDLTSTHYDMNLLAIDAFFRHLRWTGDLEWARAQWPVIVRHLAWERRLFRRPFGPDKVPLYEGYAAIWASDDLAYNGGGATHASALNLWHSLEAARLARLLGEDGTSFEHEAQSIWRAMHQFLWLKDSGHYAEWRDALGLQLAHPSAALWTFYHAVDSGAATPEEAWQMARYVETHIPRLPIRGQGIPRGDFFTMSTTDWMPYTWSTNNVVMAEATHTALGLWQSNHSDSAFRLFKGSLLDSMFVGLCPGNVGMTTGLDMARGETQRDFADGVGATARALVEGLFGVQPDVLAGEVKVRPGFPSDWTRAKLRHPQFELKWEQQGTREEWEFTPHFAHPVAMRLELEARRDHIASVLVNGAPASWHILNEAVGTPRLEIRAPAAPHFQIAIHWGGDAVATPKNAPIVANGAPLHVDFGQAHLIGWHDPQGALDLGNDSTRKDAIARGTVGHHSAFARMRQGEFSWWAPVDFEIRPALEILPSSLQVPGTLRFRLRNNGARDLRGEATLRASDRTWKVPTSVAAGATSSEITLPGHDGLPGTSALAVEFASGEQGQGEVTNWHTATPRESHFEPLNLAGVWNCEVSQIFEPRYTAPRSPFVSLSVPIQGFGSWTNPTKTFVVDDSGLRRVATQNNGVLTLPSGVPFQTPDQGNNIAFVSQWSAFPSSLEVPLNGNAKHLYLLLAGSTNSMQSRFDNGELMVNYTDGTQTRLALHNPTTWWPIDQDYRIDDFAFARPQAIPPRVYLKSGEIRVLDLDTFKGTGKTVPGGAATVLDLPLDPHKTLRRLQVRALANEVVIGLMSATLVR